MFNKYFKLIVLAIQTLALGWQIKILLLGLFLRPAGSESTATATLSADDESREAHMPINSRMDAATSFKFEQSANLNSIIENRELRSVVSSVNIPEEFRQANRRLKLFATVAPDLREHGWTSDEVSAIIGLLETMEGPKDITSSILRYNDQAGLENTIEKRKQIFAAAASQVVGSERAASIGQSINLSDRKIGNELLKGLLNAGITIENPSSRRAILFVPNKLTESEDWEAFEDYLKMQSRGISKQQLDVIRKVIKISRTRTEIEKYIDGVNIRPFNFRASD